MIALKNLQQKLQKMPKTLLGQKWHSIGLGKRPQTTV